MNAHGVRSRGFSLIEVLVTMGIVTAGLLGLLALQTRTINLQGDSEHAKAAADLLSQLRERVTANHDGFRASAYTLAATSLDAPGLATVVPVCAPCASTTDIPARELAQWIIDARRRLPGAIAQITPAGAGNVGVLLVTIGWEEPRSTSAGAACAGLAVATPKHQCISTAIYPG
jgi:type IV pilus assembly protein PilV